MNALINLPNITALDLSEWNLPTTAQTKLVQMTNLQQFIMQSPSVNLSPLKNLTKLELIYSDINPQCWQTLTNLQDLHLKFMSPDRIEDLTCLSKLTTLYLECLYSSTPTTVILTALSKLKDLNISPSEAYKHPRIKLIASCTTLESIYIHTPVEEMDLDWLSLNSRLTHYHVRFDRLDHHPEKFHPLTRLTNITSVRFMNEATSKVFERHRQIKALHIDYYLAVSLLNIIKNSSILESLQCDSFTVDPTSFSNLTKLTCGYSHSPPSNLKVLNNSGYLGSMMQLSKLESWKFSNIGDMSQTTFDIEAKNLARLTRIELSFKTPMAVVGVLPKLSNLFSLKHLEIDSVNKIPALKVRESEFLTTLTNLDALVMPSLNIPVDVFNKIVSLHTQLTQLRINCSESSGEILTRLNNLQVLEFYSSKPMKGLKKMLEEKLPRLTVEVRV